MFTGLRLKNYKSLVDLEVSFLRKQKKAKKAVIVYGENGVGKSNFISAFYTLCESLQTLSIRKVIQQFLEGRQGAAGNDETILNALSGNLKDTESIIKSCKTIHSDGNMLLEFGFCIENKEGRYLLEYDNSKIVHEKLEYVLNKNRTVLFDLSEEERKVNHKIFPDKEYAGEIRDLYDKYCGKHSLMAIIANEKEEKANGYVESRIHERLFEVIAMFMTMSVKVKSGNGGEVGKIGLSHKILSQLEGGAIDLSEEDELNLAEELVNEFFTKAYSDVKQVFYKREYVDDRIKFELVFRKKIYNRLIDVGYAQESTGTMHLLDILPFLMMSVVGTVVVIDEVDAGIHDLLVENLLSNIIDSINGQLIITTHNTMLLESNIDPEYIYTFTVDKNANKRLTSIVDFEDRTHPNLNYRNRYLRGMYGGVPVCGDIDFEELSDILE